MATLKGPRLDIINAINLGRPIPIADGSTGDVITLDAAIDSSFPNGRRLGGGTAPNRNQVNVNSVLISLIVAGNPAAGLAKGVEVNDKNYLDRFPFLAPAHQGLLQGHGGINVPTVPNIPTNRNGRERTEPGRTEQRASGEAGRAGYDARSRRGSSLAPGRPARYLFSCSHLSHLRERGAPVLRLSRRSRRVAVAVWLAGLSVMAHDMWIEPARFTPNVGDVVSLRLRVGEGLLGDPLPRDTRLVREFVVEDADGRRPVVGRDGSDPAGPDSRRRARTARCRLSQHGERR